MKYTLVLLLFPLASCTQPSDGNPLEHSPTERKMIGLMEKFDRWDEDGNGRLDLAELNSGMIGSEHKPANVLKFYDTSGDGFISLTEAQAGYQRAHEADAIMEQRKKHHD